MKKISILFSVLCAILSTSSFASSYTGLGKQSINEATIRKFAPKPLDPVLEKKIQSMLDVRAPGAGLVAPDGKTLIFTWSVTGTSQIWRIDGPNTFPVQMTGGKALTTISDITPDGKWLIVSRDEDGEENPGLYIMNPKGGSLIEIQKKKGIQTRFEHVSDDSKWIYFSSNDIAPDSYTIYRYNLDTKKKETVFDKPGIWSISDVWNEQRILLQKSKGSTIYEYWTLDTKSQQLAPVIGQDESEEYAVSFATTPDTYFVLTPKLANYRTLYALKDKQLTSVTGERPYDVNSFMIDHARKKLYFTVNDKGYGKVFAKDAHSYKDISLPKLNGVQVNIADVSRNSRYVTFAVATAKSPMLSYVLDWKSKKLTQWVTPSTPEVNTSAFVEDSLEYYPARDGTPIPMFVKRPEACKNKTCPVVVDFHGGPEGQSTPGFSGMAQLFVNEGYVYVKPNVRGSDGYGKKWLDADNKEKRLSIITDIEDCSKFIKKNWAYNGVTPRVGVMGGSYGGYTSLLAMTYFAGAYDVGVSNVGISNLVTFLNNTAPYRRILRINEYGDPVKDKDLLVKLSPITYISKTKDPLLVIQGVNDPRVPVGEAIQIYNELESRKISTGLVLFADEGHGARKRDNIAQTIGQVITFFNVHLKK